MSSIAFIIFLILIPTLTSIRFQLLPKLIWGLIFKIANLRFEENRNTFLPILCFYVQLNLDSIKIGKPP